MPSLWDYLLHKLGLSPPPGRSFRLDAQLARSLRVLAEQEQRPADEVAAELLVEAMRKRDAAEVQLRRWRELSRREQEVVALTCLDYTNDEIAAQLVISRETVKTHLRNALFKFDLRTKNDLREALADWDFSAWVETKPGS
jgi:DNA-binding CsgD family transcriptional regulator